MKSKIFLLFFSFLIFFGCVNGVLGGLEIIVEWTADTIVHPVIENKIVGAEFKKEDIQFIAPNKAKIILNKINPGDYKYNIIIKDKFSEDYLPVIIDQSLPVRVDAIITAKYSFKLDEAQHFTNKPLYPPEILVSDIQNGDNSWTVTLSTLSPNSDIFYILTDDVTKNPTDHGSKYSGPFDATAGAGMVLRAVTKKEGWTTSTPDSVFYFEQTPPPVVSNITSSIHNNELEYKAESPETIYWTLDDTPPTTFSTKYTESIKSSATDKTISFRAKKDKYLFSDTVKQKIKRLVAPKITSIVPNSINSANSDITITLDIPAPVPSDYEYFYTKTGVAPSQENIGIQGEYHTTPNTVFTIANILETETFSVRAVGKDYLPSLPASIPNAKCVKPFFVDDRTDFRATLRIKINEDSTPPVETYYTIGDSTIANPLTTDNKYTSPFEIANVATTNIKARTFSVTAVNAKRPSDIENLTLSQVNAITVKVGAWNYLQFDTTTANTKIFYTIDNSDPKLATSLSYSDHIFLPFSIADGGATATIKFLGAANLHHSREETSPAFNVAVSPLFIDKRGPAATPPENLLAKLTIQLTTPYVNGETVHFTRNASKSPYTDKNFCSILVGDTIEVEANEFIKAVATGSGSPENSTFSNIITSKIAEIDGTALPKPTMEISIIGEITLLCSDATATILYKINSGGWTTYSANFPIQKNDILTAVAVKEFKNPSAYLTYTFNSQVVKPELIDNRSDLRKDLEFEITPQAINGVKYYYTLNPVQTDPIPGNATTTEIIDNKIKPSSIGFLSVRGAKTLFVMSDVTTKEVIKLSEPTITLETDNIFKITKNIADVAVTNYKIFYTIDGSDPKISGTEITSTGATIPFATNNITIKTFIAAKDCISSDTVVQTYNTQTASPAFADARTATPNGYRDSLKVRIENIPAGATVKYSFVDVAHFQNGLKIDYTAGDEIAVGIDQHISAFATIAGALSSNVITLQGVKPPEPTYQLLLDNKLKFNRGTGDTSSSINYSFNNGTSWETTYIIGTPTVNSIVLNDHLNVVAIEEFKNPSSIKTNNFLEESIDISITDARTDYRKFFTFGFNPIASGNKIYFKIDVTEVNLSELADAIDFSVASITQKTVTSNKFVTFYSYNPTKITKRKTKEIVKATDPTVNIDTATKIVTINTSIGDTAYWTEKPNTIDIFTAPFWPASPAPGLQKDNYVHTYTAPFEITSGQLAAIACGEFKLPSNKVANTLALFPTPILSDARVSGVIDPALLKGLAPFNINVLKVNDGDPTIEPNGFYTLNGVNPTASDSLLGNDPDGTNPFNVLINVNSAGLPKVLKVSTTKSGYFMSLPASVVITKAGKPIIDVDDSRTFVIKPADGDTDVDTFFFFERTTAPIIAETLFTGTHTINANDTIKAFTVRPFSFQSDIQETTLTKVANVAFSHDGSTRENEFVLTLTTTTPGAYIVVSKSLDGVTYSAPTNLGVSPVEINITSTVYIKAFANKVGMYPSDEELREYKQRVKTPSITYGSLSGTDRTTTISTLTPGASIRYKINGGADITATSASITIPIAQGATLETWGIKAGWEDSLKIIEVSVP